MRSTWQNSWNDEVIMAKMRRFDNGGGIGLDYGGPGSGYNKNGEFNTLNTGQPFVEKPQGATRYDDRGRVIPLYEEDSGVVAQRASQAAPSYSTTQTPANHFTNLPSGSNQQFNAMRSAIGLSPMDDSDDNDANIQKAKGMMGSIVGLTPNTNNYSLQDAISQLRGQYSAPVRPSLEASSPPVGPSSEPDFMADFSPAMRARFAATQARSRPEGPDQENALMARARANAMRSPGMKSGGGVKAKGSKVKAYAKGGSVSASSRADGCAQRGKTRGMMR
jgi:hypothetical protein